MPKEEVLAAKKKEMNVDGIDAREVDGVAASCDPTFARSRAGTARETGDEDGGWDLTPGIVRRERGARRERLGVAMEARASLRFVSSPMRERTTWTSMGWIRARGRGGRRWPGETSTVD